MNNERPASYRVQNACENCKFAKEDRRNPEEWPGSPICVHDAPRELRELSQNMSSGRGDHWVALTYFRTVAEHGICDHYEHK